MTSKFMGQLSSFQRYLLLRILKKCGFSFELWRLSSGFVLSEIFIKAKSDSSGPFLESTQVLLMCLVAPIFFSRLLSSSLYIRRSFKVRAFRLSTNPVKFYFFAFFPPFLKMWANFFPGKLLNLCF